MRLTQCLGDVSDVTNAKGDRVCVKEAVGELQCLGIGFGPDQPVNAALRSALNADIEHRRVDVRNGDRGARPGKAESDVAGTTRHVENRLTFTRLDTMHEPVFPQPVHPARHRVIHQVIA